MRDCQLGSQRLRCSGRMSWLHAEVSADVEQRQVDRIILADRFHVFEVGRVPGMINGGSAFDHDYEARGIYAVSSLGLSRAGFGVEHAARMNRRRHRNRPFAVRNLNLTTDAHDGFSFSLLTRKLGELYQVASKFGIGDQYRAGLPRNPNGVTNMVAMSMRQQNVVNLWHRGQGVLAVACLGIRR